MLLRTLALLSGILAACTSAYAAGSLSVSPINLTVRAGSQSSSVTVRNMSDRPTNVQAQVFELVQDNGAERMLPASRVAVSPPFVQLQPRQDYVFRVIRLGSDPVQREEAYRLLVRDVPSAAPGSGVSVSVGHSIPVFFAASGAAPAKLQWRVSLVRGAVLVHASNVGGSHTRVTKLAINDGHVSLSFDKVAPGWVLPGATMTWSRPAAKVPATGPLRLSAEVDGSNIDVSVDPDR